MERKVTISPRKPIERPVRKEVARSVRIYFENGSWEYDFEGHWNAHLLQKVAKGLRRGWIRSKRDGIKRPVREIRKTATIPVDRPGENLGVNPIASVRPMVIVQPSMPLAAGTSLPVLGPLEPPDAASMQPKQPVKTETKE